MSTFPRNKVGVALSSELDSDRLVQLLINISVKGLRAEIGLIMLIGEDDTKLVMRGWSGLGNKIELTLPVSTGESVSGKVAIEARILAVADAYDAMITARPYRSPRTKKEAIAELRRCSGTQFDPLVVENFIEILETDPEILKMEESLSSIGT